MKRLLWLLIPVVVLTACSDLKPPKRPFASYELPPPPDYRQPEAWSCLPDREDSGDLTPPGVSPENQAAASVDVFFIHPTTFEGGVAWNAHPLDRELNAKTDEWAIRHQATVYNVAARVYAPRYRQMALGGFFTEDSASKHAALRIAYEDVRTAFQYYLAHYNQGRPLIIAGHSQGSLHGIHLLREFFDGKPLQEQLVAAYLPGWPIPANTYAHIPVCDSATQTGCVASWCSWKEGVIPKDYDTYYRGAIVVNPVSWTTDTTISRQEAHLGFLGKNFKTIHRQALTTQIRDGYLWVSNPLPFSPLRNYHIGDYNLFWVDIRENVAARVAAFQGRPIAKAHR
ncbi:MAG: DUF3089 domain-containing protein [Bacteroidetes bacterium]|nr:MAG: DUF3089 domain-containing protein [Bacteroidota bacterium]